MNTMTSSSNYNDLYDFLTKHNVKNNSENKGSTHTRMPNTELKVYGAAYHIPEEELPIFVEILYEQGYEKSNEVKKFFDDIEFNDWGRIYFK
jgi:hypothetical protein